MGNSTLMFRLRNPQTPLPAKIPRAIRHIGTVKEEMWTEVDGFKLRKGKDFITQEGLQEYIVQREDVDILLLGSQPGCGKTAGLLMAALDGIDKKKDGMAHGVLFVKKELVSTKDSAGSITQDAKVFFNFADCVFTISENPTASFEKWNTTITFTHANFPNTPNGIKKMQEKFKNFQCARIFIDEATDHNFSTFTYLQSRNRDTSGVVPRMVLTFNVNSWHWTRQVIDWWLMLDPETGMRIADPKKIGKIRYACIKGSTPADIVWGDTKEEVVKKANIVVPPELLKVGIKPEDMVRSIAFRPAVMSENMEMLAATQGKHAANVFNTGGAETRKLWNMDWDAEEESPSEVSYKMIDDLFSNPVDEANAENFGSADVSVGGDLFPFVAWRGHTITAIELIEASDPSYIPVMITRLLEKYNIPMRNFAYDGTGVGEYLKGYINARPIVANTRAITMQDEYGNDADIETFANLNSQIMGKMQYYLETRQVSCEVDAQKTYPHGRNKTPKYLVDILKEEAEVFKKSDVNGKTKYNSKLEFKHHYGYSPDITDAIKYRFVFDIENPKRKEAEPKYSEKDYYSVFNDF